MQVFGSTEETTMPLNTPPVTASKGILWSGWVMSALPALFLLMDGVMKLM